MSRRKSIVVATSVLGLVVASGYGLRARAAGIPATNALSYSGVIEDANGPYNGTRNVQVLLYDAATAGNVLCQSATAPVTVTSGRFKVQLPDTCTTAIGVNSSVFADVLVDGSDTGRAAVGAVPFAVEAKHATAADTATTATNAGHAASADSATNAGHAATADSATSLTSAGLRFYSFVDSAPLTAPCANTSGSTVDCTCPAGSYVVAGGAAGKQISGGMYLRESRPLSATTWRTTCATSSGDVLCPTVTLLCSSLGP